MNCLKCAWKSIDLAPKDRDILLWIPRLEAVYVGCWDSDDSEWMQQQGGRLRIQPSHWIDIPSGPES